MCPFAKTRVGHLFAAVGLLTVANCALAQDKSGTPTGQQQPSQTDPYRWQPLSLADESGDQHAEGNAAGTATKEQAEHHNESAGERFGYREVSDFFNIREANPQVEKGEFEIELESRWFTRSNGKDDDLGLAQSFKYGITEDLFVELEVEEPSLGDGANQGNGNLSLILYNRFVRETETIPAVGGFVEMRLPTGDGSSGVDAKFSAILTKTIVDRLRAHLQGYIETANGDPGGGEEENRRHFQWGIGPGFDYQIDDKTLALINYINKSSEEYGHHNSNILQLGAVREIFPNQHLKLAIDIGLDGQPDTPNFGAKLLWSIDWK